jgi:membrane fusion protein, multidrug efflux system
MRSQYLRSGLFILMAGILLATTSCSGNSPANAQVQMPPPTVQVAVVERRPVALTTEWIATLDGFVNAEIQPHVSGYLVRQNYREGAFVRKGEVLFEIDPRPFQAALDQVKGQLAQSQAQVAQAQAQLVKASQDVTRDAPLAEARAIAQSQLDNDLQAKAGAEAAVAAARAAVTAAQAAVEQADLNMSFTQIVSLVDGIAGIAKAQVGDLVATNTLLTSVSQVDPIKAYFPMSEQDYLRAQKIGSRADSLQSTPLKGIPLTLVLADGSTFPHQGEVLWTDLQVDPSTGTIRVAAAFPNPGNILRPGGYGRVRAVTEKRADALLVPQAAIVELQGVNQVAVVESDNKVKIQNVQLGSEVEGSWVVNQGLGEGDRVVVGGMQYARDGATVNPVQADASQGAK